MKFKSLLFSSLITLGLSAQNIEFTEYNLDNGLHVILHQDNKAPIITTSVMYHVGSKDETPNRTGFAHFFEHLLFEGTENIERGQWDKIVASNAGQGNANTSQDRTYYYETFPSNNLELSLWMESERMFHPVINQIGVDTQNEVVKEEKRQSYDNEPYGYLSFLMQEAVFKNHPYRWMPIGKMEHIDAATLEEFKAFHKKFYIPNNATLVVAGDLDIEEAKTLINKYFSGIPKGDDVIKKKYLEEPINQEKPIEYYDDKIELPLYVALYRTPSQKDRDAYVLEIISEYLSGGRTAVLYDKMVEKNKTALQVSAYNSASEDYGYFSFYAVPFNETSSETLFNEFDVEIEKLKNELIPEKAFQKIQNGLESSYISGTRSTEGIASQLATYNMLYGNTNLINDTLKIYQSITRDEIKEVANKYFNSENRAIINYLPKKEDK